MTLKVFLGFNLLMLFASCMGQNTKDMPQMSAEIGNTVSEIDKSIWVIFQDKKNNYWFGSNGNGVYRYDGTKIVQFTTNDGLNGNQIRGIQEDKSGNIYFDTPGGVTKFDGKKFISLIAIKSLVNNWKLQPDDMWFKGNGDILGALRYDGDTLHHLEFSMFNYKLNRSEHSVYSIYKDTKGNVWFGTLSAGVCRYDGVDLKWIFDKELSVLDDGRVPAVRSILEDANGYFWFSNIIHKYKIHKNDLKDEVAIKYDKLPGVDMTLPGVRVKLPYYTSAIIDTDNNIWMTNYNEGVWKFDGKEFSRYRLKDGGTNSLTITIYKDNMGVLWVGTDNTGVYKFNGSSFVKFSF